MARVRPCFVWRQRVRKISIQFLTVIDNIHLIMLNEDQANVLHAPLDQLLFNDHIQRIDHPLVDLFIERPDPLVVLKQQFHIRRGDDREPLGIIFLEPVLRLGQKSAQKGFLKEGKNDLEEDEHHKERNNMSYFETVLRQFRRNIMINAICFQIH